MAKSTKITKKKLLEMIEEKLQPLYLLKGALMADESRKQDDLDRYFKQFQNILKGK